MDNFDLLEDLDSFDVFDSFDDFDAELLLLLDELIDLLACYLSLKRKYFVVNLVKPFIFLNPGFIFQECIILFMSTQKYLE